MNISKHQNIPLSVAEKVLSMLTATFDENTVDR